MSSKRSRSFIIAVHWKDCEVWSDHDYPLPSPPHNLCFMRMVRRIAKEFLVDERDRQYYADHYSCWPPPMFVPALTLIEVSSTLNNRAEKYSFTIGGVLAVEL